MEVTFSTGERDHRQAQIRQPGKEARAVGRINQASVMEGRGNLPGGDQEVACRLRPERLAGGGHTQI